MPESPSLACYQIKTWKSYFDYMKKKLFALYVWRLDQDLAFKSLYCNMLQVKKTDVMNNMCVSVHVHGDMEREHFRYFIKWKSV